MASVGCVLSEDQFLCSICLEVFTDPVTTSCGHSFCKTCINKHWDISPRCHCPVCKESFSSRPQLKLNTFMSEMVCQFKNKPQDEDLYSSEPRAVESGEVLCDVCSEPKLKALKSCLVCLLSYCQSHLDPHITIPRLKKHQLILPVENLEDRSCSKHDKSLELFCRDDHKIICVQCICEEHENHNTVPLKKECEVKQKELEHLIRERREKAEEIQRLVKLSQKHADREMEEGIKVFNNLMKCIEQSLEQFKQSIEEKQKKTEEEAARWIKKIEREISSLEQRRAEMEQLWSSKDHLHFLQTFTSVKPAPSVQDWTELTVKVPSYERTLAQSVSDLHNTLLHPKIKNIQVKAVQQYAVDVTLDPDTAYPFLVCSKDLKQVYYTYQKQKLPNNPESFSSWLYVLGKQKFSSGRFYFEVQVKGKTESIVGVAKESINRKIKSKPTSQDGFWYIMVSKNQYQTSANRGLDLPLKSSPEKVGVFVDYEEGLVSFYDVDAAEIIYSFTNCCFTENILPLFNPCGSNNDQNVAPLILTPVAK